MTRQLREKRLRDLRSIAGAISVLEMSRRSVVMMVEDLQPPFSTTTGVVHEIAGGRGYRVVRDVVWLRQEHLGPVPLADRERRLEEFQARVGRIDVELERLRAKQQLLRRRIGGE